MFEMQLNTDQTWTSVNAATFGQDLSFSGAVDNGVISDLQIQLQVDGTNEVIRLSSFTLMRDPFVTASVPEPGSLSILLVCAAGFAACRRRL